MRNLKLNIRTFFAALVCAVFLINVSHELIHTLISHHEEIHSECSEADEKDECHLYMVHNIKSEKCDGGHDHYSSEKEKCLNCIFFKEKQKYAFITPAVFAKQVETHSLYSFKEAPPVTKPSFTRFLRGPPQA